jgi:hypothetical protein
LVAALAVSPQYHRVSLAAWLPWVPAKLSGKWPPVSASIFIKGAGCKSGGCALKAAELMSGELTLVAPAARRKQTAGDGLLLEQKSRRAETPETVRIPI